MMKFVSSLAAFVLYSLLLCVLSAWLMWRWMNQADSITAIRTSPVTYNVVNYSGLSCEQMQAKLNCYGKSPVELDYTALENYRHLDVNVMGKLCDRTFNQQISVPVGTVGNWKFYAGAGVAAVAAYGAFWAAKGAGLFHVK